MASEARRSLPALWAAWARGIFARQRSEPQSTSPTIYISGRTPAGVYIDPENALKQATVWACVTYIARTVAQLPWHVMLPRVNGGADRQVSHPVDWLLNVRPNPDMGSFTFRQVMLGNALRYGNGYAEIERDMRGIPVALWPVHPRRVMVDRGDGGGLVYRIDNYSAGGLVLDASDMCHIRGFGDGPVGMNVIEYAAQSIGWSMATEIFGAKHFGDGMNPSGVVEVPGSMSPEGMNLLRQEFRRLYSGPRAERTAFLDAGMKWQKLSTTAEESQYTECCVPGTLVTMADGSRRAVELLVPGDAVIGWNHGPVVARVAGVGTPPIKPLVRIITARGRSLTMTSDHPCLGLVSMRAKGGRPRKNKDPEWLSAADIKVGQYLRVGLGMPEGSTVHRPMNFDTAWMLGALTGDGYVPRTRQCSFASAEPAVIAAMARSLELHGASLRGVKAGTYDHMIATNGNRAGSPLRTFLNSSGLVGKGAAGKRVPHMVMIGGREAWVGFLSGYADTDGCVHSAKAPQPSVFWASINRELLEDCQHLLAMLGVQSSIYVGDPGGRKMVMGQDCLTAPSWRLHVYGASPLRRLAAILKLEHVAKREKLAAYLDLSPSRYSDDNFDFDRVIAVESLGEGETVGVEIEGIHTHITNGIVTHNTMQHQVETVCRWFGVPPHKVQHLLRSTFSNIEHQAIEVVTDTIVPWIRVFEDEANYKFFGLNRQGLYTNMPVEGLLRGDTQARAQFYRAMRELGAINVNEIRAKEDMNGIGPKGDVFLVPANMVSLERAIEGPPDPPKVVVAPRQPADEDDRAEDEQPPPAARRNGDGRRLPS